MANTVDAPYDPRIPEFVGRWRLDEADEVVEVDFGSDGRFCLSGIFDGQHTQLVGDYFRWQDDYIKVGPEDRRPAKVRAVREGDTLVLFEGAGERRLRKI